MMVLQLALVGSAAGEGNDFPTFGISPLDYKGAYFDLILKPGETRQLKVEVGNYGKVEGEARTFAADVYTIVNGGFGAKLDDEHKAGTTLWLDYASKTLLLPAGKALQQSFTVQVPIGTLPGEYITSLVVQNS